MAGHCYQSPVYRDGILYYYMSPRDRFVAIDSKTGTLFYDPVQKNLIKAGGHKTAAADRPVVHPDDGGTLVAAWPPGHPGRCEARLGHVGADGADLLRGPARTLWMG